MATQTSSFTNFNTLARAGEYTDASNTFKWVNRTNAQTSNNVYANLLFSNSGEAQQTFPVSLSNATVNYFVVTGLSSTVPSGATINGITVKFERFGDQGINEFLTVADSAIYLTKDGTNIVGNNKSTGASWATSDNNTTTDFGGASDLWGTTLTAAEVNASTFGVMISPSLTSSSTEGGSNVKIDQVTILVDYTGGAVRRQGIFTSAAELRTV
jgi:hypothetical protein